MRIAYILIAILLGIDNIFIRFRIGGLSYDRLFEFILFFIFLKAYLLELKSNPFFKKWNTFIILFASLQLLINLKLAITGHIEFEDAYIGFVKCFSFLVFSFLFLMIAKKDMKYVNIIVFIHFLVCIFAFLQHPLSPIGSQMMEIKKLLYSSGQGDDVLLKLGKEEAYISGSFGDRFRLSGPFASSISFSYFAISSFIINFYMYLRYKKKIYLVFLTTLIVASLLSQTRSLMVAEIFLVLGYLFFAPFQKHSLYKLALVISAILALSVVFVSKDYLPDGNSRLTQISSEGESDSRPLLWITGLYTVLNHPLGITTQDYNEVRKEMFIKTGNSSVLKLASHNGLINVGFHYSFLGYFLIFFFILFLLRYINLLEPKSTIFFKLVLLSYLIQTSFHNDFIFNSDYPFFMVLMLIYLDGLKNWNKPLNSNQFIIQKNNSN
jgi:hypothetical protein